jgi:DnaJ family protein A protein 2
MITSMVSLGGNLVTQQQHECNICHGSGQVYKDKDKCKKCKGERTVPQKKFLELYIPPGARDGEKVVLHNEADQGPDDLEPGDLVFVLTQEPHDTFTRKGNDLTAEITVTLSEALTGLERVVIKHLDGRGIQIKVQQPKGKILRPGQVIKIAGEGMPIKKTDHRGDLYLVIHVEFPADGYIKTDAEINTLKKALPPPGPPVKSDLVDEVDYEESSLESFGGAEAGQDEEWEDEDGPPGPQCATQ